MRAWHNRAFPKMEAQMWSRLKLWWRAEGDLVQLRGLDPRLLADMGLKREDLRDAVHGRQDPAPDGSEVYCHPLRARRATG